MMLACHSWKGVAARLVNRERGTIEGGVEDHRAIWVKALDPDFGIDARRIEPLIRWRHWMGGVELVVLWGLSSVCSRLRMVFWIRMETKSPIASRYSWRGLIKKRRWGLGRGVWESEEMAITRPHPRGVGVPPVT